MRLLPVYLLTGGLVLVCLVNILLMGRGKKPANTRCVMPHNERVEEGSKAQQKTAQEANRG